MTATKSPPRKRAARKKVAPAPVEPSKAQSNSRLEITVPTAQLVAAVKAVAAFIPSRPAAPVLGGVRLRVHRGTLIITSWDLESLFTQVVDAVPGSPSWDGVCLAPGKALLSFTSKLKSDVTTVEFDGTTPTHLQMESGMTCRLSLLPLEDYPDPGELDQMPLIPGRIDREDWRQMVEFAAVAAGSDDTLPALTGIKVEARDGVLRTVATDRYRLAIAEFDCASMPESADLLVPAKNLVMATRGFTCPDLELGKGESTLTLTNPWDPTNTARARVLDGEFPKYRALIPTSSEWRVRFPREALAAWVNLALTVTERNQPVRVSVHAAGEFVDGSAPCAIRLTVGDSTDGAEAFAEVAGSLMQAPLPFDASVFGGKPGSELFATGFNPRYLLDGLRALPGWAAEWAITEPTKPSLFTGDAQQRMRCTYLLMPVRLAQ